MLNNSYKLEKKLSNKNAHKNRKGIFETKKEN